MSPGQLCSCLSSDQMFPLFCFIDAPPDAGLGCLLLVLFLLLRFSRVLLGDDGKRRLLEAGETEGRSQ